MQPSEYNFRTQRAGDTFKGLRMTFTRTSNEVTTPIDFTGDVIKMQVKAEKCLNPILSLTSESNGGITIEDAVNGVVSIDSFLVPDVKTFNYIYDIQIEYSNGVVETYLEGNFPIISDVTD